MTVSDNRLIDMILRHIPENGTPVGNKKLMEQLAGEAEFDFSKQDYQRVRDMLVSKGVLARGGGRGGSVRLIQNKEAVETEFEAAPDTEEKLTLEKDDPAKPRQHPAKKTGKSASGKRVDKQADKQIISYRYSDKRRNNPHVGMVDTSSDGIEEQVKWAYDPHIDPELQFDISRSQIEDLVDNALASGDQEVMRQALEQLRRMQAPYLNWTGKAERTSFEVDTVSLHVHDRIDPATILSAIQKRLKAAKGKTGRHIQTELFSAPFENLPLRQAIDFYKHERDWANRLISGDSLLVMNSLIQKESMAGQVQMIYIDPPYGIKYGSNFQPFVNKRDVKDRKDEDLTQEPEMIKAFRDTWELGIHSYLTYLRDRLLLARELLHESGSVFVQISDENLHHVRELMDEVFKEENFCATIPFITTSSQTSELLASTHDYLLWYSKDKEKIKFRRLYKTKRIGEEGGTKYTNAEMSSGERLPLNKIKDKQSLTNLRIYRPSPMVSQSGGEHSSFTINFQGGAKIPRSGYWKTNKVGISRLTKCNRIVSEGQSIAFIRYLNDFPVYPINSFWDDTWGVQSRSDPKRFVVQTAIQIIERCLLMTTDPGDLVLDPTCGSGTNAYVAEKWGRRWITCDTSRVAVTLAKQRLMTASYDYYELKYPQEGIKGGFIYKTVPHITLKSIANNPEIDEIHERMHPAVEKKLAELNAALRGHDVPFPINQGGRKGQTIDFQAQEAEPVTLPSGESAPAGALLEWEVPFEFPEDWPETARKPFDEFHRARQAMQQKMDQSIAAHADRETLYDQPEVSKNKLRITGPFTVEAVPFPSVLSLEEAQQPEDADMAVARSGETSRQARWRDELVKTGIRGKGGQKLQLADLEPLPDCRYLHAIGTAAETGERVAVSFGPEYAALEQRQVEIAMREAGELFPLPKILVFCAFTFDPEAAKDIDNIKGITALKAQMNTDLLTEDLKSRRASNESFWLMGQPDVEIQKIDDDQYRVEVHGFDYFDTKTGELVSGGKNKIAMWELDTDYDDRSLFPRQVFFPMAGAKDGWHKLKKDIRAELDEEKLGQYHSTVSLPFEPGDNRRIAIKIIDDRGIESLKIMNLD
ncbi:MAG: site-specific DNA-methyltransferase [Desulfobacterales bacterium]